jgi:hypothetical protein
MACIKKRKQQKTRNNSRAFTFFRLQEEKKEAFQEIWLTINFN